MGIQVMTVYTCDRCNARQESNGATSSTFPRDWGSAETPVKSKFLCAECLRGVNRYLDPLPAPALPAPVSEEMLF